MLPRIIKIFAIAVIATVVGVGIGFSTVRANTLNNLYVPGAGNVATAGTVGWFSSGQVENAYGKSTSSTVLYFIYAGMRRWHQGTKEQEAYRSWFWNTGGTTDTRATNAWSPGYSTKSIFQADFSSGSSTYYTGWPDASVPAIACATYWNTGNLCY